MVVELSFSEIRWQHVVCVCVYPSSSLGWKYGMNGNSGSCRQPN